MEDSLKHIQPVLERERRAREKQERELASAGKGKRISTLHRDTDFTLECPGPVSPPPAITRPLTARSSGETTEKSSRTNMTVPVRYCASPGTDGPSARARGNGAPAGRRTDSALGEFERRLVNAKRLGKTPMPSADQIPWYHPSISRHIAESLLMHRDICDGTYLLRNSSNSTDSLTLSVRCRTALRHYRVQWDGRQFCFGLGKFPDVASFEDHFRQCPMISGDSSVLVKLANPYPRGVVEPHDYQEANEVAAAVMEVTMELTTASLAVNSKEGFLTKLGFHRKNWKIRWFTLCRNELKYFNTKEDKTPLRVINLDEATAVEKDDTMGKPNCFRLVLPHRTFFMIACSDAESVEWVQVLRWRLENNSR